MAWFEGTHEETRPLPHPPERVIAFLQDVQNLIAATKGVESADVDGSTVHFVMAEEDHGVVKFKGDYFCTYATTPTGITWTSRDGNLLQSGEARVTAADGGSSMYYTETVKIDLGVPAMMAPMLKPVIGPMMVHEVKEFVKRFIKAI